MKSIISLCLSTCSPITVEWLRTWAFSLIFWVTCLILLTIKVTQMIISAVFKVWSAWLLISILITLEMWLRFEVAFILLTIMIGIFIRWLVWLLAILFFMWATCCLFMMKPCLQLLWLSFISVPGRLSFLLIFIS